MSGLKPPFRRWRLLAIACLAAVGAFLLFCVVAASGSDKDLIFVRDVSSDQDVLLLDQKLHHISQWAEWHHMTVEARAVDPQGHPLPTREQVAATGKVVQFIVRPKQQKRREFNLTARIKNYQPSKTLEVTFLDDSKGKLKRLFDRLEWKIEILPSPDPRHKNLVRGTLSAHTASWRARLFGTLAPRVLMNQAFYPDVPALAGLQKGEGLELFANPNAGKDR